MPVFFRLVLRGLGSCPNQVYNLSSFQELSGRTDWHLVLVTMKSLQGTISVLGKSSQAASFFSSLALYSSSMQGAEQIRGV